MAEAPFLENAPVRPDHAKAFPANRKQCGPFLSGLLPKPASAPVQSDSPASRCRAGDRSLAIGAQSPGSPVQEYIFCAIPFNGGCGASSAPLESTHAAL